jgi:two-component system response regulator YesN
MIVDDMDIVRREIKRFKLWGEKSGFIISEEAKNGQDALIKIEKTPVDLVITDIKMPKIDGIELLRDIVEKELCSCVVLLSDFSEFSYARQGLILGAFDYIAKPINEGEMDSLLKRANIFITNKVKEKARVRKLEETLDEKNEEFIQTTDIARLIELIQSRDINIIETTSRIVDRIGTNLNYDVMRAQSVLKNGISEIVNVLIQNNNWLERFVDAVRLKNMEGFNYDDFNSIKILFIDTIQEIITILNTLQYGFHDKGIVWQVCNCVLENIDNEISLKVISDKLYMNRTYVSEAFKQKTGISFVEYITLVKIERAKILIVVDKLRAYEIAEKLGFNDTEYFSKIFKKHTGMSTTQYRQISKEKI